MGFDVMLHISLPQSRLKQKLARNEVESNPRGHSKNDYPTVGVIVHASKLFKIASPPCAKIETPRLSARVG